MIARPTLRQRWLVPLALAVVAALIGVALLGGNLAALTTSVVGLGGDPYQTLWRMSALTRSVAQVSLTVPGDPIRNLGPLPWLPLTAVLPDVLAYNLVWILEAPLAALSVFLLGRFLSLPRLPAALAGVLVAFAPYRLAQSLGHFGAMQIFWFPLSLAALLGWCKRPTVPRTLALGAALTGTAWTEHTLFLTTLFGLAVTTAMRLPDALAAVRTRRGAILALLALAVVMVASILPFLPEIRAVSRPDSALDPGPAQRLRFAPTLESLLKPAPFHWTRKIDNPYGTARGSVADDVHSLGVVAVSLALLGAAIWWRTDQRSAAALALLALVGLTLALLPWVPGGQRVYQLPVLSAIRVVNRFLALAVVAIPLLAARAVSRLPRAAGAGLAAVLLLEILPVRAFPLQPATTPAYARRLADERAGPILEVPAAADYLVASRALHISTAHGHPVLGHRAFERVQDPAGDQQLLQLPAVRDLLLLRADLERPTFFNQDPRAIARAALASEGVVAVVVHNEILGGPVVQLTPGGAEEAPREALARVRAFLEAVGLRRETLDSLGEALYLVPPWPERQSAFVAIRGEGWERASRDGGDLVAAVKDGATFEVRVLGREPITLVLSFETRAGTTARGVGLKGREVQPVAAPDSVLLPLGALPPGRHTFALTLESDPPRTVDAAEIIVENPSITRVAER